MGVGSVLCGEAGAPADATALHDLNLDQVVDALAPAGPLRSWLARPLRDVALVRARQDVFRDLADPAVHAALDGFVRALERTGRRQ